MDLAGPLQVLHCTGAYRIRLASSDGRAVHTDVGLRLDVGLALADVGGDVDTVLVAGYSPNSGRRPPDGLVAEVRRIGGRARRVASICTGALLLARAGFLDGRRATTHWAVCGDLATRFPLVAVQPDAIWVRDGPVLTSAGVTAGIDLALALVAEDLGADRARVVAMNLLVFLARPGGQAQFDTAADRFTPRDPTLRRVLDDIRRRPAADHRLAEMAHRVAVSERQLTRLFRRELETSPARYVEQVRVREARTLLESGGDGVATIARRCGFGSAETMRRAFVRVVGVTPTDYRRRFHTSALDRSDQFP
ncbi:helix-turn-helix domain-containing protein [Micromonospora zingiberis]|uniref:Helix-turn-helix domain-containing protein n=2 Tax=Micromonospora zingiberis TaxID=2053011 RepID=A0A4R0GSM0_9ACTN|nr:helix-turn-helix domain-containing protein [Micromonospora zingiberis]